MPLLDLPSEEWHWMYDALMKVPEERRDAHWRRCLDSVRMVIDRLREAEEQRLKLPSS